MGLKIELVIARCDFEAGLCIASGGWIGLALQWFDTSRSKRQLLHVS